MKRHGTKRKIHSRRFHKKRSDYMQMWLNRQNRCELLVVNVAYTVAVILLTYFVKEWLYTQYNIWLDWRAYTVAFVLWFVGYVLLLELISQLVRLRGIRPYLQKRQSLEAAGVDAMSDTEFAQLIAERYKQRAYRVEIKNNDSGFGVDVIAFKADERFLIRCKQSSEKVGYDVIRDARAESEINNATRPIIVTTNYFDREALEVAERHTIELVNRDTLSQWIHDFQDARQSKQTN